MIDCLILLGALVPMSPRLEVEGIVDDLQAYEYERISGCGYWYLLPNGIMDEFVDKCYLSKGFLAAALPAIVRDAVQKIEVGGAETFLIQVAEIFLQAENMVELRRFWPPAALNILASALLEYVEHSDSCYEEERDIVISFSKQLFS